MVEKGEMDFGREKQRRDERRIGEIQDHFPPSQDPSLSLNLLSRNALMSGQRPKKRSSLNSPIGTLDPNEFSICQANEEILGPFFLYEESSLPDGKLSTR